MSDTSNAKPFRWLIPAILVGIAVGFLWGNLENEAKMPGEAIRSTDATGHWQRHVLPAEGIEEEMTTNARIRLVMQALPTYALLHAGKLPAALDALVADGLLGKDAVRDGWERPLLYVCDDEGVYTVSSAGADGLPATEDDIPKR